MTLPPKRPFPKRKGDSDIHKRFIRTFHCIVWGNPHGACDTDHKIECAHIRTAANSGTGKKPGDEWLVAACRTHHAEMHSRGDVSFERKYGVNLAALALEFAASSPDKEIKAKVRELDLKAVLRRHIGAEA